MRLSLSLSLAFSIAHSLYLSLSQMKKIPWEKSAPMSFLTKLNFHFFPLAKYASGLLLAVICLVCKYCKNKRSRTSFLLCVQLLKRIFEGQWTHDAASNAQAITCLTHMRGGGGVGTKKFYEELDVISVDIAPCLLMQCRNYQVKPKRHLIYGKTPATGCYKIPARFYQIRHNI